MESGLKLKIFDNPKEEEVNLFLENKIVYQILHAFTGGVKMKDDKESYIPWIKIYIFYKDINQKEIKEMPLGAVIK